MISQIKGRRSDRRRTALSDSYGNRVTPTRNIRSPVGNQGSCHRPGGIAGRIEGSDISINRPKSATNCVGWYTICKARATF